MDAITRAQLQQLLTENAVLERQGHLAFSLAAAFQLLATAEGVDLGVPQLNPATTTEEQVQVMLQTLRPRLAPIATAPAAPPANGEAA